MPVTDVRGLLTDELLERFAGRARAGQLPAAGPGLADVSGLADSFDELRDIGYLKIALPSELGGLGLSLAEVACAQRRLAYRAPAAAFAVNAHHYWVGAAADAHRRGDSSADWVLREASRGAIFAAGHGHLGGDLVFADPSCRALPLSGGGYRISGPSVFSSAAPSWDWVGVHALDASQPLEPRIVHAFVRRSDLAVRVMRVLPAGPPGDLFVSGVFGWGLPLTGTVHYAMARRAFDLAVECVQRRPAPGVAARQVGHGEGLGRLAGEHGRGRAPHPLDQWPVAEAALRLDDLRAQLHEVLQGRSARAVAWGVDPGGQWLIKLFAVRRAAVDGAARITDLADQIAGRTPAEGTPLPSLNV
jgi:alkylation response protein AidB-like acyl-CoA dehydrogenase